MSTQFSYSRDGYFTSSTASRWFCSDLQFCASLRDYAVVKATSTQVRHARTHADTGCNRHGLRQCTFADMLSKLSKNPCYSFAVEGQLVYADVNNDDPEHEKGVDKQNAEEVPLEVESEDFRIAREKLIVHLTEKWYEHKISDLEVNVADRYMYAMAEDKFEAMLLNGTVDDAVIGYIRRAETETEKKELLDIVSDQTQRPAQRPVLVLIGLIDDMQSEAMGKTEGWAIGYDFVKDLLIIKPFLSAGQNHPLGGSWYSSTQDDDGINYSGCPNQFADMYILEARIQQNTAMVAQRSGLTESLHTAFRTFVHTVAAKWILRHLHSLSHPGDENSRLKPLENAIYIHSIFLSVVEFPIKKKIVPPPFVNSDSIPEEEHCPTGQGNWTIDAYVHIQNVLEKEEDAIRAVALQAKEAGDHYVADRIADAYCDMMHSLTAINEGPRDWACWKRLVG